MKSKVRRSEFANIRKRMFANSNRNVAV